MNKITKEYRVVGIVQGVGFRYYTKTIACELGIKGWVKNETDGSVKIIACGDFLSLNKFKELIRKGPSLSKVVNIQEKIVEEDCIYSSFQVKY
jgi:acylphosphatase